MIRYVVHAATRQQARADEPFHEYVFEDGTVWTEFYRDGDSYLLRFPGLADFTVSADGAEVSALPVPGVDNSTVEHLYINQLVPLALSRQGQPAFHASVVTVPGGAIAFLGATGAGKSTLAASYALSGGAFLTDDALLVRETPDGCMASPSHPSVRLWDDSAQALASGRDMRRSSVCFSSKSRLYAGDSLAYADQPTKILAAFELVDDGARHVEITPLQGVGRYMAWLRNSFLLDIEDHDLLSSHFEWTHRVSGATPTFRLDYPREYAMLDRVRRTLADHLAALDD